MQRIPHEYLKDSILRTKYTFQPQQPICIYQVVTEFNRPFLLFMFCKSTDTYVLPTVPANASKIKDLQTHLNLLDYPLKYKGLLKGTLLFHYRTQESVMTTFTMQNPSRATQWLLPWEIVNTGNCAGIPVNRTATLFFLNNPQLLFLRNAETGQPIPNPRVGYVSCTADELAAFVLYGVQPTGCPFRADLTGYNFTVAPTKTATARESTMSIRHAILKDPETESDDNTEWSLADARWQHICLLEFGNHAPLSLIPP
jgi:hypothetical protein